MKILQAEDKMNLSDIIIVNHNSTDHLIACLESLEKALGELNANIFIQDNASRDGVDRIIWKFPRVRLAENPENLGFAKAVNKALRQGKGDYAVLLNPDTLIVSSFFENALCFMRENPDVGIMGPRILDSDGRLQNSARSFPTPLTAFFGRTSLLSRIFPHNPLTRRNLLSLCSDGNTPMKADWVSGACMIVRRKALDEVGPMDERFFMYWEDADWCRRMWEHGWKVIYNPQLCLYHHAGGSSEKTRFRSALEFHKSAYLLFGKYLPPRLGFVKPLVFGGLAIRLYLVLFSHLLRRFF